MSDLFADQPFPRAVLIGAAVLVGVALVATATSRITGIGTTQVAPAAAVEAVDLRFEDRSGGAVAVVDAGSQRTVAVFEAGSGNFVRGVLRGFARERKLQGASRQDPVRLTRWADGRLSLDDPVTGRHVDLGAFGPTNAGQFAQLLRQAAAGDRVTQAPAARQ
jgi:putative photosynthetic complex assembly protein